MVNADFEVKTGLHESINSYKQWDWKRVNIILIQKRLIEKIRDQSKPQIITMIMCWNSVYNDEKKNGKLRNNETEIQITANQIKLEY